MLLTCSVKQDTWSPKNPFFLVAAVQYKSNMLTNAFLYITSHLPEMDGNESENKLIASLQMEGCGIDSCGLRPPHSSGDYQAICSQ